MSSILTFLKFHPHRVFKLGKKFKLKNVKFNIQISKLIVLVEQKDSLKMKRDETKK